MSKAQQKAVQKYNKKAYDRLSIFVPAGQKDVIRQKAREANLSVNGLINSYLEEQIEGFTGVNQSNDVEYITGIFALNLPCALNTCGDWHQSGLNWSDLKTTNTKTRFFGDYGIEPNHIIPEHDGTYHVANTIRALLDLLEDGNFALAQGMNEDFICNEKYTPEVFMMVSKMCSLPNWNQIDAFMGKEYKTQWLRFKEKHYDKQQG